MPPNLATGLSDNVVLSGILNFDGSNQNRTEAPWRPTESEAPVRRNQTLGALLGGYVNGSEHLQPSKATPPAAVLQNDDPVLYRDQSLLVQETSDATESVFHNVLMPMVDDDFGKVRFSVFEFGILSLERTNSDSGVVLNIHNEQLVAAGELKDIGDHSANYFEHSAYTPPPMGAAPAGETFTGWYVAVHNNVLGLAVLTLVTMLIAGVVRRLLNKADRSTPTQQNSEQRGNETAGSASRESDRAESSKQQQSQSGEPRSRRHASSS